MKKLVYIISFLLFSATAWTQENIEIGKKQFKIEDKKDGFGDAWDALKAGNDDYKEALQMNESSRMFFLEAIEFYLKAYRYNPDNAALNYKMGVCYLFSGVQSSKSLSYLERAYKLQPNIATDILFQLGKSYHFNSKFELAIEKFKAYKNSISPSELASKRKELDKKIAECELAKKSMLKPQRILIDNLGSNINTQFPEYAPIINADESLLLFTSKRDNTTGGERDPNNSDFYEDIYVSYYEFGKWSKPDKGGKKLNRKTHDATAGLSPDGTKLIVYRDNHLYLSNLKGDEWTSPEEFPKPINSDGKDESAAFSPDGNRIYFVSDRDGGAGGLDIYYCDKNAKGKWGEAKSIGKNINSEYNERAVFLHPDGRTLYFSSDGHNTMGGYDIFRTTMDDKGNWSEPENLGYPINTPDNDLFFVVSASGRHAYFTSVREEGYGNADLYLLTFLHPEQNLLSNEDNLLMNIAEPIKETMVQSTVEIKTIRLTIVKGTVTDAITGQPVEASIEIIDNEKNELITTQYSNSKTGKYLLSLPSGKNYGIAVKAKDYLFHSENFDIPQATAYQEITKDIKLLKVVKNASIVLKNIFFETAKAILRPESNTALDRLVKIMTDYPTIKIEISGHTDNTGGKDFNWKLSEARAKSVVEYLKTKGIAETRLTFKGYADTKPIATNDTPEGRQENRRVEFKILE